MRSKIVMVLMVGILSAFTLSACGNGNGEAKNDTESKANTESNDKKEVVTDAKIVELAEDISKRREDITLVKMTEAYVSGVMSVDVSKMEEYAVYVDASGTSVDEYGVFRAKEDEGDNVQKMLQDYLDMRLDTWMDEYMPEEKPKVKNAKIKNNGDYYIYVILSDSEREEVLSQFDDTTLK